VQLGHLYYDTGQAEKAISAYTTSLKYHSGDANLITDLGVMYRQVKQPEKAIEMFEKAQAMDALHQPSRFNEGIVRFYDLKDTEGAIASWEELLKINPDAKAGNGQKIREFVDQIKSGQIKN
jgi:tetratricopeptide (TPR) repeat protein